MEVVPIGFARVALRRTLTLAVCAIVAVADPANAAPRAHRAVPVSEHGIVRSVTPARLKPPEATTPPPPVSLPVPAPVDTPSATFSLPEGPPAAPPVA